VDPNPDTADLEFLQEGGSFLAEISSSIPGIDEAMSFAEVLKQVRSAIGR
jgi:arsenite-transporting ATPase